MSACATEYTSPTILTWQPQKSAFICFNIRTIVVCLCVLISDRPSNVSQAPATFHHICFYLFNLIYLCVCVHCPVSGARIFEFIFVYNDKIIKAKQSTGCWSCSLAHSHITNGVQRKSDTKEVCSERQLLYRVRYNNGKWFTFILFDFNDGIMVLAYIQRKSIHQ